MWKNSHKLSDNLHEASGIGTVTYRKKKPSWRVYSISVKFRNGKRYEDSKMEDLYMIAFAKDYMIRPSREHCKFACRSRERSRYPIFGHIDYLILRPEMMKKVSPV